MDKQRQSSVAAHRARKARDGFVRVEVNVRKEDAGLVRQFAAALAAPERQAVTRSLVRQFFEPGRLGLKALLAAAPLEGIELARDGDAGRDVEF